MKDEPFYIKYISSNNCFLYFPERWLDKLKDLNVVKAVLRIEYEGGRSGYFSCSPDPHSLVDNDSVGISATYAQRLGMKDGESVTVTLCSAATSVSRIDVSPVTADDWEILEMSSNEVQSSLLDQVRVVWRGQVLVVWVSKSMHLSLHVDHIESNSTVGLLEPLTDVVVAPPGSQVPVSDASALPEQGTEGVESSPSLVSSLWGVFRNLVPLGSGDKGTRDEVPSQSNADSQRLAALEEWRRRPLPMCCRVHPLCVPPLHVLNSRDKLFLQPYNVFIRKCHLPEMRTIDMQDKNGILVCKLKKVPSPKMKQHTRDDDRQKSKSSNDKSLHVRLVVIEDVYAELSSAVKEYVDTVTMSRRTGSASILMSSIARSALETRVGAKVSLEFIAPGGSQAVTGIQIVPLGTQEQDLEMKCKLYIAEEVECSPLVLNSGAVVAVTSTCRVVTCLQPPEAEYAVLDPELVRRCRISMQENSSQQLDSPLQEEENSQHHRHVYKGGTMQTLVSEGTISLELSLKLTPVATAILPSRSTLLSYNILIVGPAGSGKTTLSSMICREVEQPPFFVHCVRMHCRSLKGKKVETLQKLVTQSLQDCVYYQPAVLVLDDLDCIAGVGSSSPGDEETLYFKRIGEMLKQLIAESQSRNSIAVIATAPHVLKLNSALVAPRGVHLFNTILEIPELHKAERVEILKDLTSHRKDVQAGSVDWNKIAGNTDGYVVQDLADLVDKTVFEAFRRTACNNKEEKICLVQICEEDIEEALKNNVPLLQRGVKLHESDPQSWDDIGGLSEVKQVLIEMLQWPSQYPELFENAPLRNQSGLLLYGAPGTGKSLLAGAIAHECGLRFISIKGPELLSKYIGASEEAVRNIFQKAQSAKPCILFFDEFDSLAPRRGHDSTGVTDRVVNQMLTQLDGVEALHGVYVVAATSRPDLIDPALLRPGRLDRAVHCPLPDKEDRASILRALSRKLKLADDVDLDDIASCTEGFTGADLKAVLYTAQLSAVEESIALKENATSSDAESRLDEESSMDGSTLLVTQERLKAAVSKTRPSLSESEKLKYRLIYEKFEKSRGGGASDFASMPQRATLA